MSAELNVAVAVEDVPKSPDMGPDLSYHCHENEPVPPVAVEVIVIDWPESIVTGEGWGETDGLEYTVIVIAVEVEVWLSDDNISR